MLTKLLETFLLCTFVSQSFACSCIARNETEEYCSSDFVVQVTLEDFKTINESKGKLHWEVYEYKVKYVNVYKKNKKFDAVQKNKALYSNAISAGCGVQLNISKDAKKNDYLIGGYVAKDKAFMHICGWVKSWEDLKTTTKTKLDKKQFDGDCPEKQVLKDNELRKEIRKMIRSNYTEPAARNYTSEDGSGKNHTTKGKKPKFYKFFLF